MKKYPKVQRNKRSGSEMDGLRERLIRIVAVTGMLTVAAGIVVASIFYFAHKRWNFDQITSNMEKTLASQVQQLSISFLIPEQGVGRPLLLQKYKSSENLAYAQTLSPSQQVATNFSLCERTNRVTTCESVDGKLAVVVAPILASDISFGHFIKAKANTNQAGVWIFWYAIAGFVTILVAVAITIFLISKFHAQVSAAIIALEEWTGRIAIGENVTDAPDFNFREFNTLGHNIKRLIDEGSEFKKQSLGSEIARQLAHDIRSPVHALTILVDCLETNDISEENRSAIHNSTQRINEIANSLLSKCWTKNVTRTPSPNGCVTDLGDAIEVIIQEKRLQLKATPNVELFAQIQSGLSLCANVSTAEIKRALSNLISNAIEAIPAVGKVKVTLKADQDNANIEIKDNGQGIPEKIRIRLGEKGLTFGRENGSGLGVFHAIKTIRSAGGNIEFLSAEGKGTTVSISLPLQIQQQVNVRISNTNAPKQIIIVDDDPTIHRFWELAFKKYQNINGQIPDILHFNSYQDAIFWLKLADSSDERLFLIDHELSQDGPNGLDLIESADIGAQSILVSTRADDASVVKRASEMGVRVMRKERASELFNSDFQKVVNQ